MNNQLNCEVSKKGRESKVVEQIKFEIIVSSRSGKQEL
jgi:hypothetical protein